MEVKDVMILAVLELPETSDTCHSQQISIVCFIHNSDNISI